MSGRGRDGRAVWARSLAAATLLSAPPAFAEIAVQGVGDVSIGVTDNAQSAPEPPLEEGPSRSAGAFLLLSPGVVFATVSPQAEQRLTYRYEYNLSFAESNASTSVNRLEYVGFFDLTPRLQLLLGGMATESSGYSGLSFSGTDGGGVPVLPSGTAALLALTVDETLQWDMAPGWRSWEGVTFSVQTPLFGTEAPTTISPRLRLGIERAFRFNALGAEARAEYTTITEGVDFNGEPTGQQRQLLTAAVATYRHDFGYLFTGSAEAGVLRVDRLNSGQGQLYPTGAAALAYSTETGAAQLSYRHTVTTNALLGQWSLMDEVRLHGGIPLTRKGELFCAANAGYQRGRLLDPELNDAIRLEIWLADVSLGYRLNDYVTLALRYQHVDQYSSKDPPVRGLPVSYYRNDVMIGATFVFPPERKMPRPYRAPARVDGSDELRGEPVPQEPVPRSTGTQPG
jgi:hypothetical protein